MTRYQLALLIAIVLAALLVGFNAGRSSAAVPRPAPDPSYPEAVWTRIGAPQAAPRHPVVGTSPVTGPSPAGVAPDASSSPEPTSSSRPAPGTVAQAKAWTLAQLGPRQYRCLDAVVMHESRWNPLARNPVSGAFGIPQALHGLTSPDPLVQVRWMLDYVARRYGTACLAWAHVERTGWY